MKNLQPPWLAIALLQRFVPGNDPLVGDLLEEFERRQSRAWFWRQVLLAILSGSARPGQDARPLRLVEHHPDAWAVRSPAGSRLERKDINLTASPIPGIGGLGLVALVTLVTLVNPHVWWLVLFAMAAGVLLGIALVLTRRRRGLSDDRGPTLRWLDDDPGFPFTPNRHTRCL